MRWIHRSRDPRARAGFTLIEVITVLVLLGVLAAVAVFSMARSPAKVVSEADQLAAHLRYVQIRALGDVEPWRMTFSGNFSYEIERVGGTPVRIPGEPTTSNDLAASVSLVSPPDEIRFDPWGRPVSATDAPVATDLTLTLTDGDNEAEITITAGTGLIQ